MAAEPDLRNAVQSFVMGNHMMAPEQAPEQAQPHEENSKQKDRTNHSLYLFAPDSIIRLGMWRLRASVFYQIMVLSATLACALWICIKPVPISWALHAADFVFAAIFALDIISAVIAAGFYSFWSYDVFNKIDFVTTIMYIIDLGLRALGFTYSLRSVRLFRLFKPMLRLKSFAGIKAIFLSLIKGASSLGAILLMLGLGLLVFVVVGVEFYMGSARRRCVWMDSLQEVVPTKMCKRYIREHVASCDLLQICVDASNPKSGVDGMTSQSFDHVWSALLTTWQVASGDNGYNVLNAMLEAEPLLEVGTFVYFYGINFIMTITLFTMFSAILTNFFLEQVASDDTQQTAEIIKHSQVMDAHTAANASTEADKLQAEHHAKLEEARRHIMAHWASSSDTAGVSKRDADQQQQQIAPEKAETAADNGDYAEGVDEEDGKTELRRMLKGHTWLLLVDCVILTNTTCLVMLGMIPKPATPEQWAARALRASLQIIMDVTSVLFIAEVIFRAWVAGAFWKFVRVKQNLSDAVVTLVSSLSLFVQELGASPEAVDMLRSLAVLRILRIMKVFRGTKRLQAAIAASLPRILDLLFFILIVGWLFAALGRDMFAARLDLFRDITSSALTLAAVFVSDAWSDYMWIGSQVRCLQPVEGTTAGTDKQLPGCASLLAEITGALYFVVFFFICQFILVALFVAVILDKVSGQATEAEDATPTHMEAFLASIWRSIKRAAVWAAVTLRVHKVSQMRVTVCVVEAQELITADMKEELCDTFCRVRLGGRLRQTHVCQDSFSPVWNAPLAAFYIQGPNDSARDSMLRFQVLNSHISDMYELLGECSMHWEALQVDDNAVTSEEEAAAGVQVWELDHMMPLRLLSQQDEAADARHARGGKRKEPPSPAAATAEEELLPANLQAIDDIMKSARAIQENPTAALSLPSRYLPLVARAALFASGWRTDECLVHAGLLADSCACACASRCRRRVCQQVVQCQSDRRFMPNGPSQRGWAREEAAATLRRA
jgi:hypothetical protein